jgi:primosomal protein N'
VAVGCTLHVFSMLMLHRKSMGAHVGQELTRRAHMALEPFLKLTAMVYTEEREREAGRRLATKPAALRSQ